MRVKFFILWVFCIQTTKAQFADSFSDNNLNLNPAWIFNPAEFENTNGQLHSKAAGGGNINFSAAYPFNAKSSTWFSFDFKLEINPSSANYFDYYICADTFPGQAKNGYFIRVGDTKDNLVLYRLNNGIKTAVLTGITGLLNTSTSHYCVRMVHTRDGNLRFYRINQADSSWKTESICPDAFLFNGKYGGIKIQQSGTTAAGKHYFDNLYSGNFTDTIPPQILNVKIIGANALDLYFSEGLDTATFANFQLNGIEYPSQAWLDKDNERLVHLQFSTALQTETPYFIFQKNLSDYSGNALTLFKYPFIISYADTPRYSDLCITEIMPNPTPAAGSIPEYEYIEIANRSQRKLQLGGCFLGDASTKFILPDSIINPGELALICLSNTPLCKIQGIKTIAMPGFPTLNNDADYLYLQNPKGELITELNYSQNWHSAAWKKNGGWSLERIDTSQWCINEGNWASCKTDGGTPGKLNSIAENILEPNNYLLQTYMPDSVHLQLKFKHPLDNNTGSDFRNFQIVEPGILVDSAICNGNQIELHLQGKMIADKVYHIKYTTLKTCTQKPLSDSIVEFGLALKNIDSGWIMLNEILFNPAGDGSDYVELVNTSNHILDLKQLRLANRNSNGQIDQVVAASELGQVLFPGNYCLLTQSIQSTVIQYPMHHLEAMIEIKEMPTYANEWGHVLVLNSDGNILDEFSYDANLHHALLFNNEGVSLEKFRPDLPSNKPQNWSSAASAVQYGTPGLINSQFQYEHSKTQNLKTVLPYFTPDNDGNEDVLQVNYELKKPGFLLTAIVFSENGAEVSRIFHNYLLSQSGEIFWDGKLGDGIISAGNYVLFAELFHPQGDIIRQKINFSVLSHP